MTRPRGSPPMPSAMSRPSEPVDTVSTSIDCMFLPSRMIEPLPKLRSICESAASRAFDLSMDDPSTRRSAALISRAPYDRDSEGTEGAASAAGLRQLAMEGAYTICSKFAICSCQGSGYWPLSGAPRPFDLEGWPLSGPPSQGQFAPQPCEVHRSVRL